MKGNVRVAVIGLGRLGYWHAENVAGRINSAELVCVVDANLQRAEQVALELGVGRWSDNPNEVLESTDIDAVVIATPTGTHAELIKKAAQCGKSIFVEKPVTLHLEEADDVILTVAKYNVKCQVGFMRRFDPAYAAAKKRIAAGDIGKPIYFKALSRDPSSPPAEFIRSSGGIFLDMAIHDYDLARFLMNSEVDSVTAHGAVLVHSFMEELHDSDQSLTYLRFASGAAGDVEASRNALYGYDIRSEVVGTEGTIQIGSLQHHDLRILTLKGSTHDIVPSFPERFKDAYQLEMKHFIDCILQGESPSVTAEDGKAAQQIAEAATQSFKTGVEVKLKD
ncbi:inositol 2-dehydrogenase [Paenibacillus radicis (ex Xue et al. 2023)]|uniref:Inositol 2-dehydrogenase n=1 Tax=Paenibacillus radicis (ex Xue et al. 2023) TaxID=2972489 RepID=A0ABT1YLY4_9BACL|nr:inositol 2-dehydrogenase [Paenibacillus radicis (ex Xue et al. 2023)]MCR8634164.1 inositol 2-dehydrogenase [Paenibacillus radicis (ex Xue et al. 2023)]